MSETKTSFDYFTSMFCFEFPVWNGNLNWFFIEVISTTKEKKIVVEKKLLNVHASKTWRSRRILGTNVCVSSQEEGTCIRRKCSVRQEH